MSTIINRHYKCYIIFIILLMKSMLHYMILYRFFDIRWPHEKLQNIV